MPPQGSPGDLVPVSFAGEIAATTGEDVSLTRWSSLRTLPSCVIDRAGSPHRWERQRSPAKSHLETSAARPRPVRCWRSCRPRTLEPTPMKIS